MTKSRNRATWSCLRKVEVAHVSCWNKKGEEKNRRNQKNEEEEAERHKGERDGALAPDQNGVVQLRGSWVLSRAGLGFGLKHNTHT